jgi:hypothetical protein
VAHAGVPAGVAAHEDVSASGGRVLGEALMGEETYHQFGDPWTGEPITRREVAQAVFIEAYGGLTDEAREAIEVATQVRISEAVIDAFKRFAHPLPLEPNIVPALTAAFEAAGLEVLR